MWSLLSWHRFAKMAEKNKIEWFGFTSEYFLERESLIMVLLLIDGSIPPQQPDIECLQWLADHEVIWSFRVQEQELCYTMVMCFPGHNGLPIGTTLCQLNQTLKQKRQTINMRSSFLGQTNARICSACNPRERVLSCSLFLGLLAYHDKPERRQRSIVFFYLIFSLRNVLLRLARHFGLFVP